MLHYSLWIYIFESTVKTIKRCIFGSRLIWFVKIGFQTTWLILSLDCNLFYFIKIVQIKKIENVFKFIKKNMRIYGAALNGYCENQFLEVRAGLLCGFAEHGVSSSNDTQCNASYFSYTIYILIIYVFTQFTLRRNI